MVGIASKAHRVMSQPSTVSLYRSQALASAPSRLFRLTQPREALPMVHVDILGRIMCSDQSEFSCKITEASAYRLRAKSEAQLFVNERIIGYFHTVGRVEGIVAEVREDEFTLALTSNATKRNRFANQLMWLSNKDLLNLRDDRRHERILPIKSDVTVSAKRVGAEIVYSARIIDLSRSGAAVSVFGRFNVGEEVVLGTTPARVVRAGENEFAAEFYALIPEVMFSENIVL